MRDPYSWTDQGVQRRVISHSGFRLDGLGDLLPRALGASVFDVGCNRAHVCYHLMLYGASVLHGCDNSEETIRHANELFADYRHVEHKFRVVDLTQGGAAIDKAFGTEQKYDFMMFLAVYHKLHRVMGLNDLLTLVGYLADRTNKYFVWRGSREEKLEIEPIVLSRGFRLVHYSEICEIMLREYTEPVAQPSAVWARTDPRGVR